MTFDQAEDSNQISGSLILLYERMISNWWNCIIPWERIPRKIRKEIDKKKNLIVKCAVKRFLIVYKGHTLIKKGSEKEVLIFITESVTVCAQKWIKYPL
jgi:hypothetical protein